MSGPDPLSGCDRRAFLARAAAVLAGLSVAGCATMAVARVAPEDGRIRVDPGQHPSLSGPHGALRLRAEGLDEPVYLLALEDGYAALSPICTHLGCTVDVQGAWLVCPCHGSTYDRRGTVVRGPAERALRAFPVRVAADGAVLITVDGSG